MRLIPNKYKAHIAHEIDRLEYIDKRNGVKKKKTSTFTAEGSIGSPVTFTIGMRSVRRSPAATAKSLTT
jgi:hypothetical protein